MEQKGRFLIFFKKSNVRLLSIIHLLFAIYFVSTTQVEAMYFNLLLFWFESLMYSVRLKQNGVVYLGFLITFFVFLLGRDFALIALNFVTSSDLSFFEEDTVSKIYLLMFLSLLSIFWGFSHKEPHSVVPSEEERPIVVPIRETCKKLFFITLPFTLLIFLIGAYNVFFYGYGTAADDALSVGLLLDKFKQVNELAFAGFLMTFPTKEESKKVIYYALIVYALSMFGGSRGVLMYFFLYVFLYLLSYDFLCGSKLEKDIFLTKKIRRVIIICSIPGLIFLNFMADFRHGNSANSTGVTSDLIGFFVQQGGSYNVIGYTIENKNYLPPTNSSYAFGPLINKLAHGSITNALGLGGPMPSFEQMPDYGNNLGATITYLVMPDYYLSGGGFGTQYIAEQYADFGIAGVIILSLFLGWILSKVTFFNVKNWIISSILIMCVPLFLSMPRDFYLTWLSNLLSIFNIGVLLLIYESAKSKMNKGAAFNQKIIKSDDNQIQD